MHVWPELTKGLDSIVSACVWYVWYGVQCMGATGLPIHHRGSMHVPKNDALDSGFLQLLLPLVLPVLAESFLFMHWLSNSVP